MASMKVCTVQVCDFAMSRFCAKEGSKWSPPRGKSGAGADVDHYLWGWRDGLRRRMPYAQMPLFALSCLSNCTILIVLTSPQCYSVYPLTVCNYIERIYGL